MSEHNLKTLLEYGLCVTINSDDPAYFGGYVLENFSAISSSLPLTEDDIYQLAANSFKASFISQEKKQKWLEEIKSPLNEKK